MPTRADRDILQRHYTIHGRGQDMQENPATTGIYPTSAGRTPIACSNCAKTKNKCDKKSPCSRCAGRNLECTLRHTRRSSKTANCVGIIAPPDGPVAMPSQNVSIKNSDNGQTQMQMQNSSPVQPKQPVSKPASPGGNLSSVLNDERSGPIVHHPPSQVIDATRSGHLPPGQMPMSPPLAQGPNDVIQSAPISPINEFDKWAAGVSVSRSGPRFMLDWSQMPMCMGFGSINGVAQPDMCVNFEVPSNPTTCPMVPPVSLNGMIPIRSE